MCIFLHISLFFYICIFYQIWIVHLIFNHCNFCGGFYLFLKFVMLYLQTFPWIPKHFHGHSENPWVE